MNPTLLIVIALLLALAAALLRIRRQTCAVEAPARRSAKSHAMRTAAPKPVARAAVPEVAQQRHLALEWSGAIASPAAKDAAIAPAADAAASRLRSRYLAARFPGMFRDVADLLETEYVIKVARHCFEEGNLDGANELFAMALAASPAPLALRLAQLELVFLARESRLFTRLAQDLHEQHPGIDEWRDVMRLGAVIAPAEEIFSTHAGDASHPHYGPWPDMPNWIQASWDLTHEILGADFHRAMSADDQDHAPAMRRSA